MKRNLIFVSIFSLCAICLTVSYAESAFYEVYGRLNVNVNTENNNERAWAMVIKIGDITAGKYLTCFPADKSTWNALLSAYNYPALINLNSTTGQDDVYIDNSYDGEGYKAGLIQLLNHTNKIARYLQDLGHEVRIYYAPIPTIDYLKRANDIPTGVRISTADFDTARTNKNALNLSLLECDVNQITQITPLNSSLLWSISTAATNGTAEVSGSGTSPVVTYTTSEDFAESDSFTVKATDPSGGESLITVNTVDNHSPTTTYPALNHWANLNKVSAGYYNIIPNYSTEKGKYVLFNFNPTTFYNKSGATINYSVDNLPIGLQFLPTYKIFHLTPAVATLKPYYTITVKADDGTSTDFLTFTMKFANVEDSGIIVPTFTTSAYLYSIKENSANGTQITQAQASTLAIKTGTPTPKYRIVHGNYNGIFAIDATTGQITVANNTMLKRSNPGIAALNYYVYLIVEAFNTSTYQEYSNATTVQIQIKE